MTDYLDANFLKITFYILYIIIYYILLHYDRIDISEGIAKSNNSKECMICHYRFFNHRFKFQDCVCNGCNYLTMLSANISDIAITTIKNIAYRCIIHNISKSDAINLLEFFF